MMASKKTDIDYRSEQVKAYEEYVEAVKALAEAERAAAASLTPAQERYRAALGAMNAAVIKE